MNSNGIFTSRKYLAPVNGLGCTGGCGCTRPTSGLGTILGQEPGELAVGVVVWTAGAIFLYYVFKGLKAPATERA